MKGLLWCCLTLIFHIASSQSAKLIDSAERALNLNQRDSVKVFALKLKAFTGVQETDTLHALADYYLSEGILYENPERAVQLALASYKVFRENGNWKYTAKALKSLGNGYKLVYKYDSAITAYEDALDIMKSRDIKAIKLETLLNYGLGATQRENSRYQSAITYLQAAIDLSESTKDTIVLVSASIQTAAIFFEIENHDKSKYYFSKAWNLARSPNFYHLRYFIENGLAHVYKAQNDPDSAMVLFRLAYEHAKEVGDEVNSSVYLFNLADLLLSLQKYDSAKLVNDKMMQISTRLGLKENIAFGHEINSRFYSWQGKHHEAIASALKSRKLSQEIGDAEQLSRANKNLFEVYKRAGDFRSALTSYILHDRISDSLLSNQNIKMVEELETRYAAEKKDRSIEALTQQNKIQELQLGRRNLFLTITAILFLSSLIVGYLTYNQRIIRKQKEANDLKQKLLRVQLNPHFMFNSLNAIQNLVYRNADKQKTADYLARFSHLTRQILELNRRDYISLEDELKFIQNYLLIQQLRFDEPFEFVIDNAEELDDRDLLIPPMITQPFLENAIEHGIINKNGKGIIIIRMVQTGEALTVEIQDNGVGRERSAFYKKTKEHRSLATAITRDRLLLMEKSTGQKAEMVIKDVIENDLLCGTKVLFTLPLKYA